MEDNLMGLFFKDLKDDLSESVNNLPDDTNKASDDSDDVMVNTLDDPELAKMAEAFKMEAQEYDMSEDTAYTQIGNGVMEANSADGSSMLYNSASYAEPEGEHSVVTANDGSQWYQIPIGRAGSYEPQ